MTLSAQVHPQKESYWGHVNPIGPRACYDEGKRVSETMMYAYQKQVLSPTSVATLCDTWIVNLLCWHFETKGPSD